MMLVTHVVITAPPSVDEKKENFKGFRNEGSKPEQVSEPLLLDR
jgi:hypothetical protein